MSKITMAVDRLRFWLIKKLAGDSTIAINLPLLRGLYIDAGKMKSSYFYQVSINKLDDDRMPDTCAIHFNSGVTVESDVTLDKCEPR